MDELELVRAINILREKGYAIGIFTPEEVESTGNDRRSLENLMVEAVNETYL